MKKSFFTLIVLLLICCNLFGGGEVEGSSEDGWYKHHLFDLRNIGDDGTWIWFYNAEIPPENATVGFPIKIENTDAVYMLAQLVEVKNGQVERITKWRSSVFDELHWKQYEVLMLRVLSDMVGNQSRQ